MILKKSLVSFLKKVIRKFLFVFKVIKIKVIYTKRGKNNNFSIEELNLITNENLVEVVKNVKGFKK